MKSGQALKKLLIRIGVILMLTFLGAGVAATDFAVILIDRSGSMTILRDDGDSRSVAAMHRAVMRAMQYTNLGYEIAVVSFNADIGFETHQDFTNVTNDLILAIAGIPEAIVGPRTPIADAMCYATQMLIDADDGGELLLMTFTDGHHNERYDQPGGAVCAQCEVYPPNWLWDCDPDDQTNFPCTDWQDCLVIVWAMNAVHYIDYFGDAIAKSGEQIGLERGETSLQGDDFHLFEFIADFSGGEIIVITDDPMSDIDGDGVEDVFDNCPNVYNPGQEDENLDGVGDACQCPCQPGNCNGDGAVNILDITYMIAYLYLGGPAPIPYELCSADPTGNCAANILDITYLINYLYMGGPPPVTCDEWLTACGPPLRK